VRDTEGNWGKGDWGDQTWDGRENSHAGMYVSSIKNGRLIARYEVMPTGLPKTFMYFDDSDPDGFPKRLSFNQDGEVTENKFEKPGRDKK
ncbi:MAG: hypothetical protein R3236_07680, partial [Phycisphaeraceae bacterium]|nr:hypothetical protein [Phycisphaeraceae bacterium]